MIIDEIFIEALKRAIRYAPGGEKFSEKSGVPRTSVTNILRRGPGCSISDRNKSKLLPVLKDHFPRDYPLEQWLAERESEYLIPRNFELEKEMRKDPAAFLDEEERTLLKMYRLLETEERIFHMEGIKKSAIEALEKMDRKFTRKLKSD